MKWRLKETVKHFLCGLGFLTTWWLVPRSSVQGRSEQKSYAYNDLAEEVSCITSPYSTNQDIYNSPSVSKVGNKDPPPLDDGQESLVCCSSWSHKESDMTEQLNWPELNHLMKVCQSRIWRKVCVCAKSLQLCLTLWDPMNCSLQAPLSMGFSRQEYWSGLPCPSLGCLPDPGIKSMSLRYPALVGRFFTTITT